MDSTESMAGFAADSARILPYQGLLKSMEDALTNLPDAGKKVNKFKFGTVVRQFDGRYYVEAGRQDRKFYTGAGQDTRIDLLMQERYISSDPGVLSVVVSDLFQQDADAGRLVSAISSKYFTKNTVMGLVGLKSAFNGKIFDYNNNPDQFLIYKGPRALYMMVFGSYGTVSRYIESVKELTRSESGFNNTRIKAGIFTPRTFRAAVDFFGEGEIEDPETPAAPWRIGQLKHLQPDGFKGEAYSFLLDGDARDAEFTVKAIKTSPLGTDKPPGLADSQSDYRVEQLSEAGSDGSAKKLITPDVDLQVVPAGDGAKVKVTFKGDKPIKGHYLFQVVFKPTVQASPKLWDEWSTDDPQPPAERSKTLNLKNFIKNLYAASLESGIRQPEARMVFYISKCN